MVHIQRNLGELYRGRRAMGRKYVVAGLSVIAKSDVSKRNSLHITPSVHESARGLVCNVLIQESELIKNSNV